MRLFHPWVSQYRNESHFWWIISVSFNVKSASGHLQKSGRKNRCVIGGRKISKQPHSHLLHAQKSFAPLSARLIGRSGTKSCPAPSPDPTTTLAIERYALAFYYVHVNPSKLLIEKHFRSKEKFLLLPFQIIFMKLSTWRRTIMQQKIKAAIVSRRTIYFQSTKGINSSTTRDESS